MTSKKKQDSYDEIEQSIDFEAFIASVERHFKDVPDPRFDRLQVYPLMILLVMMLCAMIAGANSISSIHQYVKMKEGLFQRLFGIAQAPSYGVFWWLLTRLEPAPLQEAFMNWAKELPSAVTSKLIAIDGKHLNGLLGKKQVHLVSAWEDARGVMLAQLATDEKSNEITAIPKLLDQIDVKGAHITIDAAGCQRNIAQKIVEKGGDYTLTLKANQGGLRAEAENFFTQAAAVGFSDETRCQSFTTLEKGHGRIEERSIVVTHDLDWLPQLPLWAGLQSLVEITSTRICQGNTSVEKRYYISSQKYSAEEAGRVVRSHWGIENGLHWCMDVVFCEDASQANVRHAAENLATFRRMALSLIRQDVGGRSGVAQRRRAAAWDDRHAIRILCRLFADKNATPFPSTT